VKDDMSKLLHGRDYYKPLLYPWAFEYFQLSEKMHWLASEVPLAKDVRDWHTRTSPEEQNLITHLFRFFTQGDIDVASGYTDKFMPLFRHPELRMMMSSFAGREAVHVEAYSLLLDTIGMPETMYKAFAEYEAMADKHDYAKRFVPRNEDGEFDYETLAKTLAVYSAFTEGMQLFSSFAILLNFSRTDEALPADKRGRFAGMGQIITWSIRDESLHVEGMIKVFRTLIEENPHLWNDDFKAELYQIARDMVALEDKFIDLCFEMGGIPGLTADEVKLYIRYIADRRLMQLGLKANWGINKHPLPWLDHMLNGVEHTNFFEQRGTEYAKAAMSGSWAEVWGYGKAA